MLWSGIEGPTELFMTGSEVNIYRTITDVNRNQWNNLVTQSGQGSVFHRYEWLVAIEVGTDLAPMHAVVEKNGNPVAICPNFVSELALPEGLASEVVREYFEVLVSIKPGFGGFVLSSDDSESLHAILGAISDECNRNIVSHRITSSNPWYLRYSRQLREHGYLPLRTTCRFLVDLQRPWDDIRASMHKSRRKEVRRSEDSNIDVREKPLSEDNVDAFYDNYRQVIERVGGNPYPDGYFHELAEQMENSLKLVVATHDGREIGAMLYVIDNAQSVVYSLFPGVVERDFRPSPLVVIHSYVLQWGVNNDIAVFDFGDTSCNFEDGTFRFKEKFGGRLVPTIIWEKALAPVRWNCYRLGKEMYYRYGDTMTEKLPDRLQPAD